MNWDSFNTYDRGHRDAFETLNNQLFERYIRRNHAASLVKFRVINGSGGDGGIEAYAELSNGEIHAVQSKWFRQRLDDNEIRQIKHSILTAKDIRPAIKQYVICIPHDVNSKRIGRGGVPTTNDEESKINSLVDEIKLMHPGLLLVWWFENELLEELQQKDNEGVRKYWFDKEVIRLSFLQNQFALQKENTWLKEKYIPELHGPGMINREYQKMLFSEEFRRDLSEKLQETVNKITRCRHLIREFSVTGEFSPSLKNSLDQVSDNLLQFITELTGLQKAAVEGNEFFRVKQITETAIWPVIIELEKISPTHRQRAILPNLISVLRDVHIYGLRDYILQINHYFNQAVRLFLGYAGTGKTHGLADCVKKHLESEMPAVMIHANSTPCNNWTEIMCHTLELNGWNKEEIFSSLETIAVGRDISIARALPAGEDSCSEQSKILICIDGLEENTEKQADWCSRLHESVLFLAKYSRLRFLFSARNYFGGVCPSPKSKIFDVVHLPREGDIPVWDVAEIYLRTFNIHLTDLFRIKGLDSLFALRLFCEQYEGQTISTSDQIVYATSELLNLKVKKINQEFLSSLQNRKGMIRQPVSDALLVIAQHYYYRSETEHADLHMIIAGKTEGILNISEVDLLIDFFVQHGILVRIKKTSKESVLPKTLFFYRITYQSIIEHILSENIYHDIKDRKLAAIPEILHQGIIRPADIETGYQLPEIQTSQRIIQSIVNRLFSETDRLIGENGFLLKGFDADAVTEMQLEALRAASYEKAISYKEKIDSFFHGEPKMQYLVLNYLIVPSAGNRDAAFGSEYLHSILFNQKSAFERDKLWSGLDGFEKTDDDVFYNNLKDVLDLYYGGSPVLSGQEDFNTEPLLFAWGLTNIDQSVRSSLRVALTGWAVKRPDEFIKLLNKKFFCNDPQLQEDLALIMLGVAGHLREKGALQLLAGWATDNIFKKKLLHRNVIVRTGFRAIVEKAAMFAAIPRAHLKWARPARMDVVELINLETGLIPEGREGVYPIVHDLAWYVIQKAYDKFLEYPLDVGDAVIDQDCPEAKSLLDLYRRKFSVPWMYAHGWGMSAGISYIRGVLGLTRKKGNGWTDQSHGAKSKVYTYEEKYTWLAVHYLQGYLSDYIPAVNGSKKREWVSDYIQLTDIPNPGEQVMTEDKMKRLDRVNENWIIKEDLAPSIELTGDVDKNIHLWVSEEPNPDFSKWLLFDEKDFLEYGRGKSWTALYNHTSLDDSSGAGYTRFISTACLIKHTEFDLLKKIIETKPDSLHFLTHLDGLQASPDVSSYSNPADVVWMNWIGEHSDSEEFFAGGRERRIFYTLAKLIQGTLTGEKYYTILSKLVRNILDVHSFSDPEFLNNRDETVSFIHKKSDGDYRDNQELVLADEKLLNDTLEINNLRIFWFIDLFKAKNALNEEIRNQTHIQRTRKYFVWREEGDFNSIKFWNEYFSNERDKKKQNKKSD